MSSAVFTVSPFSLSPTSAASCAAAKGRRCHIVATMAADGRDSLNQQQQQQQQQKLSHHYQQQKQNPSLPSKRRIAQSAPLGLWDRFPTARTIQQMMDTMDRIIDDPFAFSAVPLRPAALASGGADESLGGYRRGRTPWEIKEGEGEYKMRFDIPGMTKKDVKIWVEDNMLVLKAEKVSEKKETAGGADGGEGQEEEEWAASYGRYSSRIALPESVVVEKIKAEVRDGVVYITLPKAAVSSGKVLDIDVQ